MKIDSEDAGVFKVVVPLGEASDWLMDDGADLPNVNSAIDHAASFASDHGKAFVLIEIAKRR